MAYYYELSECHEADGKGMMGALPDSSATRTVYIDKSLDPGKLLLASAVLLKFRVNGALHVCSNTTCFQWTAFGAIGDHMDRVQRHVVQAP